MNYNYVNLYLYFQDDEFEVTRYHSDVTGTPYIFFNSFKENEKPSTLELISSLKDKNFFIQDTNPVLVKAKERYPELFI